MFDLIEDKALEKTKSRALKILGSRQMSAKDISERLVQKGESEENASETVAWLQRIGAIDDALYAQSICRHYCSKSYGIARIKNELFKRGIPRDLWDEAMSEIDLPEVYDAALEFLQKKLKGSTDKDEVRKAADALCRRGFSYEDSRQALSRYLESIENTEEMMET